MSGLENWRRKEDNISIKQFIATALAEKMSALLTEEYLTERAKKGGKKKFKTALSKVKKVAPEEGDVTTAPFRGFHHITRSAGGY
ncbi:hypothetical protein MNBD_GAMMA24-1279 [hydrothermal vent metagenome]|uniref:Uncharacterized protein n=1 Tax=hydrothermal vent metagenome TaxID=652676 RepID=A0A3B1B0S7_9ZZZZ